MAAQDGKPDLDSREHIGHFIDLFYQRLLSDERLAPIFVDVANIDLAVHLPHIKDYWAKLLLGENQYRRHTMNIHRQLHSKRALQPVDFQRWLACFLATVDANYSGPQAERAKRVATSISANMEKSLPADKQC
jgi:hemoglobin